MRAGPLRRRRHPVMRRQEPSVERGRRILGAWSIALICVATALPCLTERNRTLGRVGAA